MPTATACLCPCMAVSLLPPIGMAAPGETLLICLGTGGTGTQHQLEQSFPKYLQVCKCLSIMLDIA